MQLLIDLFFWSIHVCKIGPLSQLGGVTPLNNYVIQWLNLCLIMSFYMLYQCMQAKNQTMRTKERGWGSGWKELGIEEHTHMYSNDGTHTRVR